MSETDYRGLERPARPDGAISGLLWDHDRRLIAATAHATIEGHSEINTRAVLESYSRNERPWWHKLRSLCS